MNRFYGYDIDKSAKIGLSYIYPKNLVMKSGSRIGNFNVAVNLDFIYIGENSSISRSNWITGFPTGTGSKYFSHQIDRKSELIIGQKSSITKKHHFDCTNSVHIGDYVTIAGYNSIFLTHSIDVYEGRQDSHPIIVGDYCFISTNVVILGGSRLPSNSILAASATLNKYYDEEWVIYGGVPAKPIKDLSKDAKYFHRKSRIVY